MPEMSTSGTLMCRQTSSSYTKERLRTGAEEEWIPIAKKEKGSDKVQVQDNQQEISDHEIDGALLGQRERLSGIELLSEEKLGTFKT